MYYLYEKYYKPITVQYYIADCVPRLTLLDSQQIGLTNALLKLNSFVCSGLTAVYRNTTYFCINLISCNLAELIYSNRFWVETLGFSI